jgi:pilus assembly protein Flp/PilA
VQYRSSSFSIIVRLAVRELKRLWQQEEGQDLIEYGLLVFLIALAAIASMKGLASSVSTVFKSAATSMTSSS